jgi:hypothetical protein
MELDCLPGLQDVVTAQLLRIASQDQRVDDMIQKSAADVNPDSYP